MDTYQTIKGISVPVENASLPGRGRCLRRSRITPVNCAGRCRMTNNRMTIVAMLVALAVMVYCVEIGLLNPLFR